MKFTEKQVKESYDGLPDGAKNTISYEEYRKQFGVENIR